VRTARLRGTPARTAPACYIVGPHRPARAVSARHTAAAPSGGCDNVG